MLYTIIDNKKGGSFMSTVCEISNIFEVGAGGDFNVSDLCRTVGISRQVFYNYTENRQLPNIETAILITRYLNEHCKRSYSPCDLWSVSDL